MYVVYVCIYVCMYVCMYVFGSNVTLQDILNSKRTLMLSCCLFCVFYTASESLTLLTPLVRSRNVGLSFS